MMHNNPAINLREAIISSFFFHLIVILLWAATAKYTTVLSGNLKNIISVDLASDIGQAPPTASNDSAAEPQRASTPASDETMSMPEQPAGNPPEKTDKLSESEKKAELETAGEKTSEIPAQKEGPANLEAYYQFIAVHKTLFRQQTGVTVNELLGEALKVNRREFFGGTGIVTVEYGLDGKVSKVFVDSESPQLKAFLEEFYWGALPSPSRYSLRNLVVRIEFLVGEGYMDFTVNAL